MYIYDIYHIHIYDIILLYEYLCIFYVYVFMSAISAITHNTRNSSRILQFAQTMQMLHTLHKPQKHIAQNGCCRYLLVARIK